MHEIIHAAFLVDGFPGSLQHAEFVDPYTYTTYVDKMATSLQALFPNLTMQQAASLSLGCLGSAGSSSTAFDTELLKYGLDRDSTSKENFANFWGQFKSENIGTLCQ